jgi:hypothetical protein
MCRYCARLVPPSNRVRQAPQRAKACLSSRAKSIIETHNAVRQARQRMFLRSSYLTTKNIDLVANRLYLPLSNDDRDVNMILGALTFDFGTITLARVNVAATRKASGPLLIAPVLVQAPQPGIVNIGRNENVSLGFSNGAHSNMVLDSR